jgi:hypothetical protein
MLLYNFLTVTQECSCFLENVRQLPRDGVLIGDIKYCVFGENNMLNKSLIELQSEKG